MPQTALIFLGWVVGVEDGLQPGQGFGAQLVAGTQEQPAVRPGRVDLHAAPAPLFMLDPLADVGEQLVGKHHQVEAVRHDPGLRQRPADPRRIRSGRVDRHNRDAVPELLALQGHPGLQRRPGAARGEPDDPRRVGLVQVDDRGHPRVAASPTGLLEEPADGPGPGLVDADHRRGGLPERLDRSGHQDAVHRPPGHAIVCCDFAHRPVRRRHRRTDLGPQPRSQPGPGQDLVADLSERPTRAQWVMPVGCPISRNLPEGWTGVVWG